VAGTLEGSWRAEEGDYEFDFRWTSSGVDVTGKVMSTGEELYVQDPILNQQYALFAACRANSDETTEHVFALVAPDRCEDRTTRPEYYRKVSK
jgi:hypothetical protein